MRKDYVNEDMHTTGISSTSEADLQQVRSLCPAQCPAPGGKGRPPTASDLTSKEKPSTPLFSRARGIKDLHAHIGALVIPVPAPQD